MELENIVANTVYLKAREGKKGESLLLNCKAINIASKNILS